MPRRHPPPRTAVAVETLTNGSTIAHNLDGATVRTLPSAARTLRAALAAAFLPAGDTPPDYMRYQAYDSLQALTSYVRGVVASASVLRGLGVGDAAASALSATAAWLLRDAVGMATSLAFAAAASPSLDADAKSWRLDADVANDLALNTHIHAPWGCPGRSSC